MSDEKSPITCLLDAWSSGDPDALGRLMPLVIQDLHGIARRNLSRERRDVTLQTTELVNEVYLRLAGKRTVQWQSSRQFFAEMATMIRRILIDYARNRLRAKRGGGVRPVSIDQVSNLLSAPPDAIFALDDALRSLAERSRRQSLVVHLRYFVGLSVVDIAQILEVTPRTVKRDWSTAKLWLYQEISQRRAP